MVADNVVANNGTGGATFRSFSDGTIEWPASVATYVTGGSAGAWTLQQVDVSHGLPTQGTVTPADGFANPTTATSAFALLGGWDATNSLWRRVQVDAATGTLKVDGSGATQPVSGTVTANQGTNPWTENVSQFGGSAVVTGTGASGAGIPRVTVSNDSQVLPTPQTSGGLSVGRVISAATTNATSIKASAGQLYSFQAFNNTATIAYLKVYNKASAPTVGTDTPIITMGIPANTSGAGFTQDTGGMGIAFSTGIAIAITGGITDADTTATAANAVVVNLFYK